MKLWKGGKKSTVQSDEPNERNCKDKQTKKDDSLLAADCPLLPMNQLHTELWMGEKKRKLKGKEKDLV